MKLYHATTLENGIEIFEKEQGLKAKYGFGFVYLCNELRVARKFGGLIFEVESDILDQKKLGQFRELLSDAYDSEPFYHYKGDIPFNLLRIVHTWERNKKPNKKVATLPPVY